MGIGITNYYHAVVEGKPWEAKKLLESVSEKMVNLLVLPGTLREDMRAALRSARQQPAPPESRSQANGLLPQSPLTVTTHFFSPEG